MAIKSLEGHGPGCSSHLKGLQDALEILKGKWKVLVIGSLSLNGKRRFNEMQRELSGITAKMLSKELKDLEVNRLVKRTVIDSTPVSVEYELTEYGKTLNPVIIEIANWGAEHRKVIMQR